MVLEPANLPDLLHLRLGILQLLHIRYCGEEKIYGYSVTPMKVWFLICPIVNYNDELPKIESTCMKIPTDFWMILTQIEMLLIKLVFFFDNLWTTGKWLFDLGDPVQLYILFMWISRSHLDKKQDKSVYFYEYFRYQMGLPLHVFEESKNSVLYVMNK